MIKFVKDILKIILTVICSPIWVLVLIFFSIFGLINYFIGSIKYLFGQKYSLQTRWDPVMNNNNQQNSQQGVTINNMMNPYGEFLPTNSTVNNTTNNINVTNNTTNTTNSNNSTINNYYFSDVSNNKQSEEENKQLDASIEENEFKPTFVVTPDVIEDKKVEEISNSEKPKEIDNRKYLPNIEKKDDLD